MSIRAVLFDIYGTLLEVRPSPDDADHQWSVLWKQTFGAKPRMNLAGFAQQCAAAIAREHASAEAAGILFPEIFWPDIVRHVVPELRDVRLATGEQFILAQCGLWHQVQLMPGVGQVLKGLAAERILMGLVSNCQAYSLREVERELASIGLDRSLFAPDLCFFSFEHGYSKPNPHVFRELAMRLRLREIGAAEILMVGDRKDNDIEPARVQGWQTWRLRPTPGSQPGAGTWLQLEDFLAAQRLSSTAIRT